MDEYSDWSQSEWCSVGNSPGGIHDLVDSEFLAEGGEKYFESTNNTIIERLVLTNEPYQALFSKQIELLIAGRTQNTAFDLSWIRPFPPTLVGKEYEATMQGVLVDLIEQIESLIAAENWIFLDTVVKTVADLPTCPRPEHVLTFLRTTFRWREKLPSWFELEKVARDDFSKKGLPAQVLLRGL